ncbi:phospholipase A2 inhibitor gamma subunit B-like [Pyxicephalus adspersus]|uniref:phospholipase A2 inhibitor gamma subunit B-like n=1 Tax=Pyxicephalus adspersus TaxID=30357 RepID=UPI003B5A679A
MEPARSAWAASPPSCLICVLVLFIIGGNALKCYECKDLSGNPCTGESVECQPGSDVCISSLVQYQIDPAYPGTLEGVPTWVFMRACGRSDHCSDVIILRTPYTRMVTSNKCCTGNNCMPPRPAVINEESPNGLTCMGCFNLTSASCQENKPVQCRGSESQCFTYSNQILEDNESITMAGCATKTACDLDLYDDTKTQCYGGCSATHSSRIVSSLSFIALLIIMYLC